MRASSSAPATSPLSDETRALLRSWPQKGRKLEPKEVQYLEALEEQLTPAERSRLSAIPWTEGAQLANYERSIHWRIEQVVDKKVHPRELLRRLEKHWGLDDWLADFA